MPLIVPRGLPNHRFVRYVRPPVSSPGRESVPLYPLQPATRQIRVLVDTGTLEQPSVEALVALLTRSEIESCLVVQNDDDSPSDWMNALSIDRWYRFHFTTVDEAPRMGDSSVVGVEGFVGDDQVLDATGHFFGVYPQLDHHRGEVAADHDELSIADRHRAAALASAAGTLGADVIVTGARTAGRHDVADNDIAISLSPDQFTPLFGHYLRTTGNRDLEVSSGQLVGGGSYKRTHSARSVTDMYEAGIDASAPHLTAIRLMALGAGDQGLVDSMTAINTRLGRAARAVDELLGVLSIGGSSAELKRDIGEAAAEAFDRTLLYLCAAMDRYGRVNRSLLDTRLDPETQRCSLTSSRELDSVLGQFAGAAADPVRAPSSYAFVTGQLRNRIHSLPLGTDFQLSRHYGSGTAVAVELTGLAELDPETTELSQQQLDRLGVWCAESPRPFDPSTYVGDIATMATTLLSATLEYLEEFSRFLIRNRPSDTTHSHPVVGCWADESRPMPGPEAVEVLYRDLLGYAALH